MRIRSLIASMSIVVGLFAPLSANAAGEYFVGSTVGDAPTLWVYNSNKIKLCFATTGNSLGCTAAVAVFSVAPASKDNLQYRPVQGQSALWIMNATTNTAALCQATLVGGNYQINITRGVGLN